MFQNLVPSRNYTVSVAMRNGVGEGPPATVFVATPKEKREGFLFHIYLKFITVRYSFQLKIIENLY